MIKLDDDYSISADTNSFNLCVKTICKQKDETGKEVEIERYCPQSYHGSIQSAVTRYIKLKQMERVSSKEYKDLGEALKEFAAMQKEIEDRLKF